MRKEWKLPVGGIKISSISRIGVIVCLFIIVIIFVGINKVDKNCQRLIDNTENCIEGQRCAISLERSSDLLTERVRLFVIRQAPENMRLYFDEVESGNRENMVERLDQLYGDIEPETVGRLRKALQESKDLEQLEIHAMCLVSRAIEIPEERIPQEVARWSLSSEERKLSKEELIDRAYDLVYGADYLWAKQKIKTDISDTLDLITDGMEKEQEQSGMALRKAFAVQRVLMYIMIILICAILWMIGAFILHPIKEHIRSIRADEKWKMVGVHEIRYLAYVYNQIHDKNDAYQSELEYKANHDALTGIFNRTAFEKKKDELVDKSFDVALILADINNFKEVNDTKGHKVGDEAIRRVADVLGGIELKNKYCFARIGGDEFAMIFCGVKRDVFPDMEREVGRVNDILRQGAGEIPSISVSAGVAFSEEGYSDELFRQADKALYHVKKYGRHRGHMCANWRDVSEKAGLQPVFEEPTRSDMPSGDDGQAAEGQIKEKQADENVADGEGAVLQSS